MPLLSIENLTTGFQTEFGFINAVEGVSFDLEKQGTIGIVGESGCGKSVTGLSIMRLVPSPPGKVVQGSILFNDVDLLKLREKEMRKVRGAEIAMIFQEPMTSLNPVFTVGNQIVEGLRLHQNMSKAQARSMAIDLLNRVGMSQPQVRVDCYPHELSGGMRQRVMIAIALSCHPKILIADEPTTALDVTIQAQILDLLRKLQDEFHMSIIMISHNLGVIAELTKKVIVMYAGQIVETASVEQLYEKPLHPYTRGLYASLPSVARQEGRSSLQVIPGMVPEYRNLPSGCRFRDRCPIATEICAQSLPALEELEPNHWVRCFHAKDRA